MNITRHIDEIHAQEDRIRELRSTDNPSLELIAAYIELLTMLSGIMTEVLEELENGNAK